MAKTSKPEVKEEPKQTKHVVAQPFRNINNYEEIYKVGDDVSHFTEARLEPLVAIGIVKKVTE